MKDFNLYISILFSFLSFTSFRANPKPHLIVGNWQLIENDIRAKVFSKDGKKYSIERLTFSSDEIQSDFTLIEKTSNTELGISFGFRIFEPFDEFKTSVILFKDICDKRGRVVFSIVSLNKEYLKVKFEKKYSSDNIDISAGVMTFERTAGPPENMP
ncbi:MAG TPA: hypothetical protein PKU77_13480 [Ferruginibacter sp.]|nr:hypothetical protein [Cytophagales bacterium]HRE64794.1 hypothetical protein [Ferruginibacter sp.]